MAREIAQGDDSALNMTPMIDVCFQLMVFFMLTLRFPSVANRFEAQLPKGKSGRELKIRYAVQVASEPPLIRLFSDRDEPLHFSFERFLQNRLREHWDLAGVPLKLIIRKNDEGPPRPASGNRRQRKRPPARREKSNVAERFRSPLSAGRADLPELRARGRPQWRLLQMPELRRKPGLQLA